MRFFMLSDLHFGDKEDISKIEIQLKSLCEEIRKSSGPQERIALVVLGDIINASNTEALKDVKGCLDYIQEELKDFEISFDFVPGNHDLPNGNIDVFDAFIAEYGVPCLFSREGAYSCVYEGINFIFADSMIRRDHTLPGELNIDAIKSVIKPDVQNILFCHHSFTHDFGSGHDTVENGRKVLETLKEMGISFVFHGHTHRADITYFPDGIIEIGCGTISKDVRDMEGIPNQFTVGNIYNGIIRSVDRFVVVNDGGRVFPKSRLYPEEQTFSDPQTIGKEEYGEVIDYIQRKVLQHDLVSENELQQYLSKDKRCTLYDALIKNKKILLLSDAGMGKSFELENLAHKLYDTAYFPFFFRLGNYDGELIEDLLPSGYKEILNYTVLLLDGFDELTAEERRKLKKQLNKFVERYPEAYVLISSRSNFCSSEKDSLSKSFDGFTVYNLCELSNVDVQEYVQQQGVEYAAFVDEARRNQIESLLYNPFYLIQACKLYKKRRALPKKNQLMEMLIEASFDVDDRKFDEGLESDYFEFMEGLEKVAFAMQLLHRNKLSERNEYGQLFLKNTRQLIAHSGLLVKDGEFWRFSHNNFREYLAARYLSKCPKEEVLSYLSGEGTIKPSWINTLGYLTGFDVQWDLCGWIAENAPSALVKYEPDRLGEDVRYDIFTKIFKYYEDRRLWFHDDLCTIEQLAEFSQSDKAVTFLINRITTPVHGISQHIAIDILRHFSSLWGRDAEVLECLLNCCKKYPDVRGSICRIAILAINDLSLNNSDVTKALMDIFETNEDDYVRCGMYEYLIATEQQDIYVEYFLQGIPYVIKRYAGNNTRIGNEIFNLVDGLKKMTTEKSILAVLGWYSENSLLNFYSAKEVFAALTVKAIEQYKNGVKSLYQGILKCCLRFLSKYENKYLKDCVEFFEGTGTLEQAVFAIADEFVGKEVCFHEFLCYCKNAVKIIIRAYTENQFVHHELFKSVVLDYVNDERVYTHCSKLLVERSGILLPEYQPRADYNAIWKEGLQNLFDALFEKERLRGMIEIFLDDVGEPELKVGNLLEVPRKFHWYSPSKALIDTLYYSRNHEYRVSEFLEKVDYNCFVILEAKRLLERRKEIVVSREQCDILKELIETRIKDCQSKGEEIICKKELGVSYFIIASVYLMQYFDFDLPEEVLTEFISIPSDYFEKGDHGGKYEYLKKHLSKEKIKAKLVEDLQLENIHRELLRDHIEFCADMKFEIATQRALLICKDTSEKNWLRFSALEYLYKLYGPEYICREIIPYVDEAILIEIAVDYKDIPRDQLRTEMEKVYRNSCAKSLIPHLIASNSKLGLEGFLSEIKESKRIREDIRPLDSVRAIGMVSDPELLSILGEIVVERFTPGFADEAFYSLKEALIQAFINCGKNAPELAIEEIERRRIPGEEEENTHFCNYIVETIRRNQRMDNDIPKTLEEVKKILGVV